MERYVAFLAGMNVGGHRVTGDVLRGHFEQLGYTGVATFLASGNVVLSAAAAPVETMRARIEAQLEAELGYAVPTFLRTAAQVRDVAAHEPFPAAAVAASRGKLQVAFLADAPDAAAQRAVLAMSTAEDRLAVAATELYWLPSGGISDSALDLKTISANLGPMTMRTANTVRRIVTKLLG